MPYNPPSIIDDVTTGEAANWLAWFEDIYDQAVASTSTATEAQVVTPEEFGGAGNNSTDNTDAIRLAVDSLITGGGKVKFGPGTYLVQGGTAGLDNTRSGNALIPLPLNVTAPAGSLEAPRIVFEGAGSCLTTIRCDRITDTYSATNGPPSIIGGPTWENEVAHLPENLGVIVREIDFKVTADTAAATSGPRIAALDFGSLVHATLEDCQIYSSSTATEPVNEWNFGLRLPRRGNWGRVRTTDVRIFGFYAGCVFGTPHVQFDQITCSFSRVGFAMDDQTIRVDNHSVSGKYMSVGDNSFHFGGWNPVQGLKALTDDLTHQFYFAILNLDIEDSNETTPPGDWPQTLAHFYDPTNRAFGVINYNRTLGGVGTQRGLTGGPGLILNGAANITFRELRSGGVITRDSPYELPSEPTMPEFPPHVEFIRINGTTTITALTDGVAVGERHTLKAQNNNLNITNGGTMQLSGNWGGATSQHDTLTILWDGTNWLEVARSGNNV